MVFRSLRIRFEKPSAPRHLEGVWGLHPWPPWGHMERVLATSGWLCHFVFRVHSKETNQTVRMLSPLCSGEVFFLETLGSDCVSYSSIMLIGVMGSGSSWATFHASFVLLLFFFLLKPYKRLKKKKKKSGSTFQTLFWWTHNLFPKMWLEMA